MENIKFFREKEFSRIKNPVFLVSLPVAAVSNVILSSIREHLNAQLIGRFVVDDLPLVFVNKNNVEFPSIKLFHKKIGKSDLVMVISEFQPKEDSVFKICKEILDLFLKMKGRKMIIIDGVKTKEARKKGRILYISNMIYNIPGIEKVDTIGPLIGGTAVLLGLAKKKGISTTAFLTEIDDKNINSKDVKKNVLLLNEILDLNINISAFNKKIEGLEKSIRVIDVKRGDKAREAISEMEKQREYIG